MQLLKAVRSQLDNYHLKSGMFHFHRGEFSQAAGYLNRAIRSPEAAGNAHHQLSLYYLTQTHIGAGEEHEERKNRAAAIQEYRQALEMQPGYPDLHYRIGSLQVEEGNLPEAIRGRSGSRAPIPCQRRCGRRGPGRGQRMAPTHSESKSDRIEAHGWHP